MEAKAGISFLEQLIPENIEKKKIWSLTVPRFYNNQPREDKRYHEYSVEN